MSHIAPRSMYFSVFGALMVLTVLTVAVSRVNLGTLNLPVALLIAVTKALLVILFFMHVKFASRLTKIFVGAAFLWLGILFALTFADYLTRNWTPNSRGWNDGHSTPETGQRADPASP